VKKKRGGLEEKSSLISVEEIKGLQCMVHSGPGFSFLFISLVFQTKARYEEMQVYTRYFWFNITCLVKLLLVSMVVGWS
jgi:hypothetical protein